MRKPTLLLGLTVLVTATATFTAANVLLRSATPATRTVVAPPLPGGVALGDPTPRFVGDSEAMAVAAIDATAWDPMNRALINLARRFQGSPYKAFSLDDGEKEQLKLDLTGFDGALFVEQVLALANSRKVDTQAEGVERFAAHVRRLRYENGEVDYCRRQHYVSRWAEAAERNGYLVNLTAFLPGATSREQALTFMGTHAARYKPLQQARNRQCIGELERDLVVNQAYVPLAALPGVLPSLRSGDIYALVSQVPGLDVSQVGYLEVSDGVLDALHAVEGSGVIRSENFEKYAAQVPEVIGVAIYRPRPNDGMPERPGPTGKPKQAE